MDATLAFVDRAHAVALFLPFSGRFVGITAPRELLRMLAGMDKSGF